MGHLHLPLRKAFPPTAPHSGSNIGQSESWLTSRHMGIRRTSKMQPPEPNHQNEVMHFKTLAPWETELLADTTFCDNFTSTILRANKLTLASDGGIRNAEGAYSWVLDADGVIIAANRGMARGHPMQSFRAEAYGTLAALSLLRRYCEF